MPANLENSAVTWLEKLSFRSNPKERLCQRLFKLLYNCKLGFNSTWTVNFQMYKLDLEKAEESEIKFPTYSGWSKKQEFQKSIYFCFIDYTKAFDCVDHNKLWKVLKQMGVPEHLTCHLRKPYAGQNETELDMEQWTGSKLRKEYIKALYCHPVYSTYMQRTSCEMPGCMKHKLGSRLLGEISVTSDMHCGSAAKGSACNAGDLGSILGLGSSPGEGKGCPLQYSSLENSMDCIVHGVTKRTQLSDFHFQIPLSFQRKSHSPYGRKWRGTKKPLDESESGEWKS